MLDAKVLAAVLATLTAVATAMNGGAADPSLSIEDPELSSSGIAETADVGGFVSNPVEFLKQRFTSRPEPTNMVQADLTVEDLESEQIRLQDALLKPGNLSMIKLGNKKMSSDSAISFGGFSGTVKPGDSVTIKGSSSSVTSSGVNVSGSISVDETVNSTRLIIQERGKAKISFSKVNGTVSSESASTTIEDPSQSIDINSFRGEIRLLKDSNRIVLDGQVDRLEAGSFSFGG